MCFPVLWSCVKLHASEVKQKNRLEGGFRWWTLLVSHFTYEPLAGFHLVSNIWALWVKITTFRFVSADGH
jgi:hypothetical protein